MPISLSNPVGIQTPLNNYKISPHPPNHHPPTPTPKPKKRKAIQLIITPAIPLKINQE